jgi:hypothetical protein
MPERHGTYREGLLNVSRDKIIISVLASRAHGFWRLRRQFRHALDGTNVALLLGCRESGPERVSTRNRNMIQHQSLTILA